jgi:Protein of unknown function (DUF3788)
MPLSLFAEQGSVEGEVQMKKRLFIDADTTPTEALLRRQLGNAMEFYSGILQVSGDYRKQWQYSRGNGWLLKVDDMRKALYYLIAFDGGIEISLTVRDSERAELTANPAFESLRGQLDLGTKYPEGYALRFEIENAAACVDVARFLTELIKLRAAREPAGPKGASRARTAAGAKSAAARSSGSARPSTRKTTTRKP